MKEVLPVVLATALVASFGSDIRAHGLAGKRFFPTTIATDDPFMNDEFSIVVSGMGGLPGEDGDPSRRVIRVSAEMAKRITPHIGISIEGAFEHVIPDGESTIDGFENVGMVLKYQFLTNDKHETLLSVGLATEFGGTGSGSIGADSFSTVSPTFYIGKGFGDLPDAFRYLKPFAITGVVAGNLPTRSQTTGSQLDQSTGTIQTATEEHSVTLSWGASLQYSVPYLQAFVQDIGLREPFDRMIPIVETALDTCLNRGCDGQTTGTVDPGLIWVGKYLQLGLEAIVPINDRSGHNVGGQFLFHLFTDDLFPESLGRPVFGGGP